MIEEHAVQRSYLNKYQMTIYCINSIKIRNTLMFDFNVESKYNCLILQVLKYKLKQAKATLFSR